ncbi:FKBP-type peptidyl-prolyl cis-trans isomerase [Sediminibacterium sp.]|uniref:FKBP-type peptidyl-prolyl cis-trans isomerase n=1 Tax=Sediminibacterium sp. TaxID=1917865 RepID=UPI00271F5577|nr:FKBP-type peptidyl-prolyl cis-trans isomerase [Sediminibacterium sp.]MDO9155340.1 FKBP-type peptidyl-prolyl cis-trans isomerase [Sediminibacterium sp.]MDP2422416.1 FKBP-type peptidyl-prolyl cis-trans isomerase [Sediminibacterium sp.]
MKKILSLFVLGAFVTFTQAQAQPSAKAPVKTANSAKTVSKPVAKTAAPTAMFKSSADSASYALGIRIAQNLKSQGLDPLVAAMFQKGITDGFTGKKSVIADELLDLCIGNYQQKLSAEKSTVAREAGKAFQAKMAKKPGVVTLPSGLQYEIIKNGTDTVKPKLTNKVKCHYHGTVISGEIFDSSVDRGEPVTFPLGNVILGWQEGLQLMTVGSKWKFYVPADLAYGDQQKGDKIAPGSLLIFEVELLGVE